MFKMQGNSGGRLGHPHLSGHMSGSSVDTRTEDNLDVNKAAALLDMSTTA